MKTFIIATVLALTVGATGSMAMPSDHATTDFVTKIQQSGS